MIKNGEGFMQQNNQPEIHESNEAMRQRMLGVENNIKIQRNS